MRDFLFFLVGVSVASIFWICVIARADYMKSQRRPGSRAPAPSTTISSFNKGDEDGNSKDSTGGNQSA